MSCLPSGFKSRAFLEFKQAQNQRSFMQWLPQWALRNEKHLKMADRRFAHLPRLIRAQANKQSHHPLKEGLMKCTKCHDQHGSSGPKMLKADTANELCFKCHAESAGHFCGKSAGCRKLSDLHVPHGSNHGKLLSSKPPLLCQSCHDATRHPGTIYTRFETFPGSATSGKNGWLPAAAWTAIPTFTEARDHR